MAKQKPFTLPERQVALLLRQRKRIAAIEWPELPHFFGKPLPVERDPELMAAIADWRRRKNDEIDMGLRKLGVLDVGALLARLDRARADFERKQIAIIEAALKQEGGHDPEYQLFIVGGEA